MGKDMEKMLDLCARLPYGVRVCACGNKEHTAILKGVIGDEFFLQFAYQKTEVTKKADTYNIKEIKPYLRPMSDMTDKEECELSKLVLEVEGYETDWYYKHHFDFRGLIAKGMALVAPKDMYKIEK